MYKPSIYSVDKINVELRYLNSMRDMILYSICIGKSQLKMSKNRNGQISEYIDRCNNELSIVDDTIVYFQLELEKYERDVHNRGDRYCPM